jgi:hypothetical protein
MMDEILKTITDAFFAHWGKVAVGATFMLIGWVVGWWRARQSWKKKEFFGRINFSLNSIHEGKLKIRTLMEKGCDEVFLNQVAVSTILDSATKTSQKDPIIPLPAKDYWFYLNSALNEVSEKFADGFIRRDAGHDLKTTVYYLCLTNESDGAIRTRKIRAMLIRKDDLLNLPEEMPELESKNHKTRWNTLIHMANNLESKPHQFFTVELIV